MSELNKEEILARLGLSEEQGRALLDAATKNPMEALALLQTYNPDPATLQDLMSQFMTNPQIFVDLAISLGVSQEQIDKLKGMVG
ncbi:MAG: DUF2999 family protein [Lentisphaeraceae bacterium]|nr:DUF2999 family protein [Lentisphaeraceae bacterium]MCM8537674.1 DUF2999 family protein [Lentisphaeraceae bacterium]